MMFSVVLCAAALVALAVVPANAGSPLASKVVYSLNAGGNSFVSSTGVQFQRDTDDVTQASPKGVSATVNIPIRGAMPQDMELYTTERYAQQTFSYNIPRPKKDGEYTLALFFSEVYFQSPNSKVFDVFLNRDLRIVESLDIFATVGYGAAYNVFVPITIKGNEVETASGTAPIPDTGLLLEFVKGSFDNPKVCGFALVAGNEDVARELFPLDTVEDIEDEDEEEDGQDDATDAQDATADSSQQQQQQATPTMDAKKDKLRKQKRRVTPPAEETSLPLIPIAIAVGVVFAGYKLLFK
ncbi:hypothetical protein PTSG_00579 [Salpingoeca rosetta]|uniref:Malectin domain-containing protein n=1 Tax=Salpingoeca rosetta (strain ATCC 50818 / BSB-021) TaxID=946362 RepID=F2TWV9_SALR5|nr:uncharacterized protein PTSG_00579 [Salpingoeca rosetta]EGD72555.1 hypothetical protein PTSG_00579 [Salpingoeca rosetta]|eukprot:XP_004999124.1 hypothetical protein PTSG_00579 [Salpingoeca rosetta]